MTYLVDSSITHENIHVTKTHTSVFQSTSASLLSNKSVIVAVQFDGWMDGYMDGWMDGWTNEWMDGFDGQTD